MTQTRAPIVKMKRLGSVYALNSSSIIPPQIIVPMMIIDCEEGTAFSDGNKLSRWFIVVILKMSDVSNIVIESSKPRFMLRSSSSSLSTSIRNLVATLLMPAYRPVMHDSAKSRMSNRFFSFIY